MEENLVPALPLQSYSSLLSRAPAIHWWSTSRHKSNGWFKYTF
jgi:hypothetical protein